MTLYQIYLPTEGLPTYLSTEGLLPYLINDRVVTELYSNRWKVFKICSDSRTIS